MTITKGNNAIVMIKPQYIRLIKNKNTKGRSIILIIRKRFLKYINNN